MPHATVRSSPSRIRARMSSSVQRSSRARSRTVRRSGSCMQEVLRQTAPAPSTTGDSPVVGMSPRHRARGSGRTQGGHMYALIGRVQIKQGHEEETAVMAREHGPALVQGWPGARARIGRAPSRWRRADPALSGSSRLKRTRARPRRSSTRSGRCRKRPLFSSASTSARSPPRCNGGTSHRRRAPA